MANALNKLIVHVLSERDELDGLIGEWRLLLPANKPLVHAGADDIWNRLWNVTSEPLSKFLKLIRPRIGHSEFQLLAFAVRGEAGTHGLYPFRELDDLIEARNRLLGRVSDMLTCDGPGRFDPGELDAALVRIGDYHCAFAEAGGAGVGSHTTPASTKSKNEGAVSQGVFAYNGKQAGDIQPAPWRLLEFMEGRTEADSEEAYRHAIRDHQQESTDRAINSMIRKANAALEAVEYPSRLSKPKNVSKIIWA